MTHSSGLLRLPNELIIQIAKLFLQDIDPFEKQNEAPTTPLRNLCLTSRHLFAIAQPVLVSYITLEDVYSTILFIRTLKEKQHLRNYVIDVNVRYNLLYTASETLLGSFTRDIEAWKTLDASTRKSQDERRVLEQIKKTTSRHAGHEACTFGLWSGSTEGHATSSPDICTCNLCRCNITQLGRLDPIEFNKRYSALHVAYAMLFCMLPNVRRLKFLAHEDYSRDPDGFGETFLNEIMANLLKNSDTRSLVLPRLKIAAFTSDRTDGFRRALRSAFFLPSLLTLRSLRQLVGGLDVNPGAVGVRSDEHTFVHMVMSCESIDVTENLLQCFSGMKHLDISGVYCRGDNIEFYANTFFDALSTNCPVLESLTLRDSEFEYSWLDMTECLSSPLRLPKLKHLKLFSNWVDEILIIPPYSDPYDLGNMLPSSIEYFSFCDDRERYTEPQNILVQPPSTATQLGTELATSLRRPYTTFAAATWLSVASAIRDGRLSNLKCGYFVRRDFGILPAQIDEVMVLCSGRDPYSPKWTIEDEDADSLSSDGNET
ncbi:hypothetical protein VdG2_05815 [Verticillium dahliae VDG2]|nr:hypothetical protein VdG2_05815 [Verticillium dahliae VDG2]